MYWEDYNTKTIFLGGTIMLANDVLVVPLSTDLSQSNWNNTNREVLWCWKRDEGFLRRTIFFQAQLDRNHSREIIIKNWYFFYNHRCNGQEIEYLYDLLNVPEIVEYIGKPKVSRSDGKYKILELHGGSAKNEAMPIISRLMKRRPRKLIPQGHFPKPTSLKLDLKNISPFVLYVGSGLSYEAGLPTLAEIHKDFGVDDYQTQTMVFGQIDPIPMQLRNGVLNTFAKFIEFHISAAYAQPSDAHNKCAELYRAGFINRILTDNVDNLFNALGVPFERTRTIFPGNVPYSFEESTKAMLVVGVAADRRSIIQQARKHGLKIIIVNPFQPVSPRAQNLSYIRSNDIWYRLTAKEFFANFISY